MPDSAVRADPIAAALAAGVETPIYVYDLAEVRANVGRLRAALPAGTGLYYSLKANPHPSVLATLRRLDVAAEVCSPGELAAALGAGWPAGAVLYTGPGKRDRDVAAALAAGVREFCVDSPTGLDQLDRLASAAGVSVRTLLRINDERPAAGQGLAMTGVASQFGADTAWVEAEPARFADRPRVRVAGLHLFMGTNLAGVDELFAQFTRSVNTAAEVADTLAPHVARIEVVDLGGGFGAPFARPGDPLDLADLADPLSGLLDTGLPGWRDGRPRVTFESGRYLVGTAGTLLTRVLDVKRSHGRDVVVLESGINHLGGMAGLRRLPPLNPTLVDPADAAAPVSSAIIAGPLCTPLDSWSRNAPLPRVAPGDLLAVPNVGAYGLYASLVAFLGHPAPVEVVVDQGVPVHVSRLDIARKE